MTKLRAITCEPPAQGVIECLEEILARARQGDISAVACAVVYRSGGASFAKSRLPSVPTMLGSTELMKRDIIEGVRD